MAVLVRQYERADRTILGSFSADTCARLRLASPTAGHIFSGSGKAHNVFFFPPVFFFSFYEIIQAKKIQKTKVLSHSESRDIVQNQLFQMKGKKVKGLAIYPEFVFVSGRVPEALWLYVAYFVGALPFMPLHADYLEVLRGFFHICGFFWERQTCHVECQWVEMSSD